MIKLFRAIRSKSIKKENIKRYFVYAIGEIFLVMIGILLALQVNNWNQHSIEKRKEKKALTDLYKEFKLNQQRISNKQQLRVSIVPKLKKYIGEITSGKATYNAFKEFHTNQFMFGMTNPSKGVIDALISSGEIGLISNDSLKYYISDWKNQVENLYENEQILWNSGLNYIESYAKSIPIPSHEWNDWNEEKLELTFKEVVSNVGYKNNLVGFEGANTIVIQECEDILKSLDAILTILEKENK